MTGRIRVLVVEDSPVMRELLVFILSGDPGIEVVGIAGDGEAAVEQVARCRPDVVTMDIHMPRQNGFEATRRIMETLPLPIIIITGSSVHQEVAFTFKCLEAGAVTVVEKPAGAAGAAAAKLLETVKLMAEVKVVRRRGRGEPPPAAAPGYANGIGLVAVGGSTGAPLVLQTLLSGLPDSFPAPVVIVQHIAPGFAEGFAEWLDQSTRFPVRLASDGETLRPGRAYLAPDGRHLEMAADGGGMRVVLDAGTPEHGHRPSVSRLFRSVARVAGRRACGLLLSGMGQDGAAELKLLRDAGAVTIAQSKESSVVAGMPAAAMALDGASYVLAPEDMPGALLALVGRR